MFIIGLYCPMSSTHILDPPLARGQLWATLLLLTTFGVLSIPSSGSYACKILHVLITLITSHTANVATIGVG